MQYRFWSASLLLATPLLAPAAEHTVTVRNYQFSPANLTIQVGDRVTWRNEEGMHNVRATDGSFRCAFGCDHLGGDGDFAEGWTFSLTFEEPGTIPYFCQPHRTDGMTGSITVQGEPQQEPDPELIPITFGLTGSWYNPATDGQGFNIEVVVVDGEPILVVTYWFTFNGTPVVPLAGKQAVDDHRWFIAVGDVPTSGEPVEMEVFISSGGQFDSADPVPTQESVGTATLGFTSCTEGVLAYDIELRDADEQQVSGEIPITRLTPNVQCEEPSAR